MGEIVLPAGLKMRMLEAALEKLLRARPRGFLDFCILFVLYSEVDRNTGLAEISLPDLAERVGCQKRAAERCIKRLEKLALVEIEKRPVGWDRKGQAVHGGRGGKNRYRLIFERASAETLFPGETASAETPFKERPAEHETASAQTQKERPPGRDTLSLESSHKNLPGASAGARARNGTAARWLSVKNRLARELGPDVFRSWFVKVSYSDLDEHGVVTLRAPSRFIATYLTSNHSEQTLRAWQAEQVGVTAVRFDHRATGNAVAVDDDAASSEHQAVLR